MRRKMMNWLDRRFPYYMNWYPPYMGAGVRVVEASDDHRYVRVEMPLRFNNQNYVGSHFGGSLFSMCDPFYMLMLIRNIGSDYIVWDKAASIQFRKPGRGVVSATFEISDEQIETIKAQANNGDKVEPIFHVDVLNDQGEIVASLEKTLYVKRKER